MSNSLVGYHVHGPRQLDAEKITHACSVVKKRLARLRKVHEEAVAFSQTSQAESTAAAADATFAKLFRMAHERGYYDPPDLLAMDVDDVGRRLHETWLGEYSDTSSRIVGKRLVVFAGDMTSGDSPCGAGYQAIDDADALGLLDLLGIM